MSKTINVITREFSQIKPSPEGGTSIGTVYAGVHLEVLIDDPESPHDGFVTIVGPKPNPVALNGTWKTTGKVGWIEYAHLTPIGANEFEYRLIVDAGTGDIKSCIRVR